MVKKIFLISLLALFLMTGTVNAQTNDVSGPGILPGSPLYFLDTLFEGIGTFFTFGDINKAERNLDLAEERLEEAEALAEQGEDDKVEKTTEKYQELLKKALEKVESALEEGDDVDEILERIAETSVRHQNMLKDMLDNVSEEAKEAIQEAIEESILGHEAAIDGIERERQDDDQDRGPQGDDDQDQGLQAQGAGGTAPKEAIDACSGSSSGASCSFKSLKGDTISGTCDSAQDNTLVCVPENGPDQGGVTDKRGPEDNDRGPEDRPDDERVAQDTDDDDDIVAYSSTSVVVDTNQTTCFDDDGTKSCPSSSGSYYGQDAQYSGPQPSYTDNGDGTVTDNNTGLMWLQDPGDKVDYYSGVNSASSFTYAGYSDWRTPSVKELYSLMDFSGIDDAAALNTSNAFVDASVFVFEYGDTSKGDREIDSQWITTDIYVNKVMNNQECFFGVNFADGRIKCYPTRSGMNTGYYLRFVRGDSGYGDNSFTSNGDGTVTDNSSSLVWQQGDSSTGLDWDGALDYCEDLTLGSKSDWRLPNAKELQYLVDYTRSPDTTSSPAINSIFTTTGITNEGGASDYPYFWTGTTHRGMLGDSNAVYIAFGRALGYFEDQWMDVHGAGAQRSDPKSGSVSSYPATHGPQGDVLRVYNYARCVRG